ARDSPADRGGRAAAGHHGSVRSARTSRWLNCRTERGQADRIPKGGSMKVRFHARLTVGIAILWAAAAGAQTKDRRLETLDAYIEKARVEWKVPAMSVAIVKDDS